MLPRATCNHSMNSPVTDSVALCEGGDRFTVGVCRSDVDNGSLGKPGLTVPYTVDDALSVSLPHVIHVLLLGAYQQVVWVHAASIVAGVTDIHSGRNGAACEFVGNPVRKHLLPVYLNCGVAVTEAITGPFPAPIGSATVRAFGKLNGWVRSARALGVMPLHPRFVRDASASTSARLSHDRYLLTRQLSHISCAYQGLPYRRFGLVGV